MDAVYMTEVQREIYELIPEDGRYVTTLKLCEESSRPEKVVHMWLSVLLTQGMVERQREEALDEGHLWRRTP